MRRVVVIGHGMVGSRFVEDLVAAVADVHVTVLGKEDAEPYNRVLLSSVVAGTTDRAALAMSQASSERVEILQGVAAKSVDRKARTVTDTADDVHPYDHLVFATGSAARVPGVQGIAFREGPVPGVSVLKDLADADGILAELKKTKRAVVLGAGVLGIEVATGLVNRGIPVTLVHHADRLMERQLGVSASTATMSVLATLGVSVVTEASVTRVTTRRDHLSSVKLTDGTEIPCDLFVMCAGTIPEAALARNAGLECDRGIVVDETLTSPTDKRVHAIGDCAQPPEGSTGLVAQGWDQAKRLVAGFAGHEFDEMPVPVQSDVVRVKAVGLNIVAIGATPSSATGARAVALSDPEAGRFIEVAVREGKLVGATCVGDKDAAARLSAIYERRTPVPLDPAHLLVSPISAGAAAPVPARAADLADDDTLCRCNSVAKGTVVDVIRGGCATRGAVAQATRASTGCGDCGSLIDQLLTAEYSRDAEPALAGSTKG